jgi:hypothetical protein
MHKKLDIEKEQCVQSDNRRGAKKLHRVPATQIQKCIIGKKMARYSWLLTEKVSHIVSECFRRKTSAGLQKDNAPRWTLTCNALDREPDR